MILCVLLGIAVLAALSRSEKTGGARRVRAPRKDVVKNLDVHPRSKSESAVVKFLEDATGHKFPTVNPSWLVWKGRTLELDGYCEPLKIALEFSGPQHTKWVPSAEPYTEYFLRVLKDRVKQEVCEANGVKLMVIDYTLPRIHWQNYVLSRLQDFGQRVRFQPSQYIRAQEAVAWRNPQLEAELGLV